MIWHILTGEYPPQNGGVSDYSRLIARELTLCGDEVHVWAPPCTESASSKDGVNVHRLQSNFGFGALASLGDALKRCPRQRRLLVQYVPHAYGWKAMNVLFCVWLSMRRDDVWIVFHEVAYPIERSQPVGLNILGVVTHAMATCVALTAKRIFVSIPAWRQVLPSSAGRRAEWLPIPSNIANLCSKSEALAVRARYVGPGECLVGHFGTYGPLITHMLAQVIASLLSAEPSVVVLLHGHSSEDFRTRLATEHPDIADRLHASGALEESALSAHISACDLAMQPYPDGVSSRRTSVMAELIHGIPVVTSQGRLTETLWGDSGAVALAPAGDAARHVRTARELVHDPATRTRLGDAGREFYFEHFSIDRTINTLRGVPRAVESTEAIEVARAGDA